ncbi:MAG TPA: ATP-binding cassette domain-containing protein [Gaiellaceae bacterium]|nr:ATP-binding cassette domain-containing protein [Gaiellaceae bacterium]
MLELDRVSKSFRVGTFGGTELVAVRDVSFTVAPGEILSVIGESGSGKSTIGRMILRLLPATSGSIRFEGADVSELTGGRLKEYYRHVQGVFQDPFSSYNPIFKADRAFSLVRDTYFPRMRSSAWTDKVADAIESVGLNPADVLGKYPHQLSGGQLQRLLIARALLLEIRFLVADEVISMLDASTRVDVLNLLADLGERGLGILFITHDLSLGNYISSRTVILRRGSIVEMGPTERVFEGPRHPYTKVLVASVPQLHRKWHEVEREVGATAAIEHVAHEDAYAGRDGAPSELVEVAPGHLVARAPGEDGARGDAAIER